MLEFPVHFKAENKEKFDELFYRRNKCYLRRDLYEHILSCDEENYFSLEKFNTDRVKNMENTKKMVKEIMKELESRGWKCALSHGETALFIYTNERPKSCWDDNDLLS